MTSIEHASPERQSPRRLRRRLGAFVVAVGVLSGCNFPSADTVPETTMVTAPDNAELHPRVASLIADGEVTPAEMVEAYDNHVDCLASAGVVGEHAYAAETIGFGLAMSYSVPGDDPGGQRADEITDRCYSRFVVPVEQRFDHPVPIDEQEALWRQRTIDCLAEIDPTYATIPPEVSVDRSSALARHGHETQGPDSSIVECIDTGGLGWTEFGNTESS